MNESERAEMSAKLQRGLGEVTVGTAALKELVTDIWTKMTPHQRATALMVPILTAVGDSKWLQMIRFDRELKMGRKPTDKEMVDDVAELLAFAGTLLQVGGIGGTASEKRAEKMLEAWAQDRYRKEGNDEARTIERKPG